MNDDDFYIRFRKQHPQPHFAFPDVTPVEDLSFERLTLQNAEALLHLFEEDDSPFVDERFKSRESVDRYVKDLVEYNAYSPKHGGQDWLIKQGDCYTGVLHLYDLSKETVCRNHKRAWIGFATKKEARGKGITARAVRHFIQTVFDFYPGIDFIHAVTEKENTVSRAFLRKLGFSIDSTERMAEEHSFFVLSRAGLS